MSAPAWTPGPWEVHHRRGVSDQFDIMPVASRGLGWVTLPYEDPAGVGEYMQVGGPCTAATARLIAAAPDLAESVAELKELLRFALLSTTVQIATDTMPFIKKAEAALAKARGQ